MTHTYVFQSEPLSNEDMCLLQGTLEKWCGECGIARDDPRSEKAAVELIDWFHFGVRNEDQLIEMIRRT